MAATLRTHAGVVELALLSARKSLREGDFCLTLAAVCSRVDLGPPLELRLFCGDLMRLASYLDVHIGRIKDGTASDSGVYVPLELAFQARAMDGEFDSGNDGYFTIYFSVCRSLEDGSRGYYGFEGVVDIAESLQFIEQLRELAAEISPPPR